MEGENVGVRRQHFWRQFGFWMSTAAPEEIDLLIAN